MKFGFYEGSSQYAYIFALGFSGDCL
jgi:hypothetical protein